MPRLDIAKVAFGALMVPWWNWRAFVRALSIPIAILTAIIQGWRYAWEQFPWWGNWFAWAIYGMAFVLCVVTCHRLVLLDVPSSEVQMLPKWTWRETRFYTWMLAVMLICAGVGHVVLTIVLGVLPRLVDVNNDNLFNWIKFSVKFPLMYLFARFSLVFPATAIDRKVGLQWAWRQTKGNGWRLVLIVGFLPWLLSQVVNILYREGASAFEVLVLTILASVLFAAEVVALSLCYRELVQADNVELR